MSTVVESHFYQTFMKEFSELEPSSANSFLNKRGIQTGIRYSYLKREKFHYIDLKLFLLDYYLGNLSLVTCLSFCGDLLEHAVINSFRMADLFLL